MDASFSGFAESVALEAGSLETDEGESLSDRDLPEDDDDMETEDIERPDEKGRRGGITFFRDGPLDYNLSTTGLRLTGRTNSGTELKDFIAKLTRLAGLLPDEAE